jgi:hypothetical protein
VVPPAPPASRAPSIFCSLTFPLCAPPERGGSDVYGQLCLAPTMHTHARHAHACYAPSEYARFTPGIHVAHVSDWNSRGWGFTPPTLPTGALDGGPGCFVAADGQPHNLRVRHGGARVPGPRTVNLIHTTEHKQIALCIWKWKGDLGRAPTTHCASTCDGCVESVTGRA